MNRLHAEFEQPERISVAGRGKAMIMSRGETVLDLNKYAVYMIDLNSVNSNEVILTGNKEKFNLNEFIKASEEIGVELDEVFSNTIYISGSPFLFDDLSGERAQKLVDNPRLDLASGSVVYWCAIFAYGCHNY